MSHPSVHPLPERTIHFIGDLHFGASVDAVQPGPKIERLKSDLLSPQAPPVAARIQVGDGVDSGSTDEDAVLAKFYSDLHAGGAAVDRMLPGNHDLYVAARGSLRTPADWAQSVGQPATAPPWVFDVGFCHIVGIGQSDLASGDWTICATADDLGFLDRAIGQTSKPVVVCSHAPLYNTVLDCQSGGHSQFTSTESLFWLHCPDASGLDDQGVRDVIGRHSNVVAFVAGHTHSDISAEGFFKPMQIGRSSLVHVSASAIYYVGRVATAHAPVRSVYLTLLDDVLELRVRDHGERDWVELDGHGRVYAVPRRDARD